MKTEILMLLDASGSMWSRREAAVAACNQFIRDQKSVEGELNMRIMAFNDTRTLLFDSLADGWHHAYINATNYRPDGVTALYDAVGYCIEELGDSLGRRDKTRLPDKVVFVIQTDGRENASERFSGDKIAEMISHQRSKYSWEFVFLGADQDAMVAAGKISIPSGSTMSYDSHETAKSFCTMSASIASYRTGLTSNVEVPDAV